MRYLVCIILLALTGCLSVASEKESYESGKIDATGPGSRTLEVRTTEGDTYVVRMGKDGRYYVVPSTQDGK
jgi:hypothetical protein